MTELIKVIQGSELAYRLGWTLLHTVWLGAAVGTAMGLVLLLLRRRSSNARYLVGCVAMILMVAAPTATFFLIHGPVEGDVQPSVVAVTKSELAVPTQTVNTESEADESPADTGEAGPAVLPVAPPPATSEKPLPAAAQAPTPAANTPWLNATANTLEPVVPWVAMVWAFGVLLLSVRQMGGWIAASRLKRLARLPGEPALIDHVARLAKVLRVSRPVRLLESMLVRVPTVLGWLRPVILLPVGLATGLSSQQMEAILAHELGHIRRYDYLVNLLQTLVETLLFYHPAMWFISRRVRAERENCCDDIVLAIGAEPFSYAESLLHVVRQSISSPQGLIPAAASLHASGQSSELRSRIARLLGVGGEPPSKTWPVALALLTAIAIAGCMIVSSCSQPAVQPGQESALQPANLLPWKTATTGPATRPAQTAAIKCKVEFQDDCIYDGLPVEGLNAIVRKPNLADNRLILWNKVTDKREVLLQDDRLEALFPIPMSVWQGRGHLVVLLMGRYKSSHEDVRQLWLFDSVKRKLVKLDILNPVPEKGQRNSGGPSVAGLDPSGQKAYVQIMLAIYPDASSPKTVLAPGSGLFAVDLDTGATTRLADFGYVSQDGKTLLPELNLATSFEKHKTGAYSAQSRDVEVVDIATGAKRIQKMNRMEALLQFPKANVQDWPMIDPDDRGNIITLHGSTVIDTGPVHALAHTYLRDFAGTERLIQVTEKGKTSMRMLDLSKPKEEPATIFELAEPDKFAQGAILANGLLIAPNSAFPMRGLAMYPPWTKRLMAVLRGSGKTFDMVTPGAETQSFILPSDVAKPKCFVTWAQSKDGNPAIFLATVGLEGVSLAPLDVPAELSDKKPMCFYLRRGRLQCMYREEGAMKFADLVFEPPKDWGIEAAGSVQRPVRPKPPRPTPTTSREAATKPAAIRPLKELSLDLGGGVAMKMVLIPAGKFMMGSPKDEDDRAASEGPQHEVTISKPFFMGVYPITQEQYEQVMGKNPSYFKGAQNPVEMVSWDDAVAFCKTLSQKTGKSVSLPTEAQWEYACRAGSTTRFSFGDDENQLRDYAWYLKNSENKTHPVGQKKPNDWGLYDMYGNVWQWCKDWYGGPYEGKAQTDPSGPAAGKFGSYRVIRSGSWHYDYDFCRSAYRHGSEPGNRNRTIGFRVVLDSE